MTRIYQYIPFTVMLLLFMLLMFLIAGFIADSLQVPTGNVIHDQRIFSR